MFINFYNAMIMNQIIIEESIIQLIFFVIMEQKGYLILEQYLVNVIEQQTISDHFKKQLSIVDPSYQRLLISLKCSNNQISCENIEDFLDRNQRKLNRNSREYIKKYLGFIDSEYLTTYQLSNNLKPKSVLLKQVFIKQQNPTSLFLDFLEHLASQMKKLEVILKKMCEQPLRDQIKQYFQRNYGSSTQSFTKNNLKQFMFDRKIYNRQDNKLVVNYMIGQNRTEIYWQDIFTLPSCIQSQVIAMDQSQLYQKPEILQQKIQQKRSPYIHCGQQSCSKTKSYHNVLQDIENIQRSLINKRDNAINAQFLQIKQFSDNLCKEQKQKKIGSIKRTKFQYNQLNNAASIDQQQQNINIHKQQRIYETQEIDQKMKQINRKRRQYYFQQQSVAEPLQYRVYYQREKIQYDIKPIISYPSKDSFDYRSSLRYNYRLYSPKNNKTNQQSNLYQAKLKIRAIERRDLQRIKSKPDFSLVDSYSNSRMFSPRAKYYRLTEGMYQPMGFRIHRY